MTQSLYDHLGLLGNAHKGHVKVLDGHYRGYLRRQNTLSDCGEARRPHPN